MHCHLERHASWGMDTVLIVKNGPTKETSIRPPPANLPICSQIGECENLNLKKKKNILLGSLRNQCTERDLNKIFQENCRLCKMFNV